MHSFFVVWCVSICFATTIAYPKNDTFKVGETRYFMGTAKMNFDDSIDFCKSHNMQLISARNSSEYKIMLHTIFEMVVFGTETVVWTSGTKLAKSNDWIWLSNEMDYITFFDWGRGEPNNRSGNEFCIALHPGALAHYWTDESCTELFLPICELK
ncbi:unnamed protein product [Psylliodes chrysocephalus]|uniref:C-type lectin domain-containing protein n=1 Tax=Psylliodes chrysocephalus TaxID=3402493 RepID=A0A9P0CZF4_9CUCU|nr:unnamed protein product [Psylliodes chrysocephala]